MYHNHITVLRGGKWCQVLSGESNLYTRAFKLKSGVLIFDFSLWKYIKLKAPLNFYETMALLYSIMQFLQELEGSLK